MINVLMDHQAFDMQKFGGVSRYFANIYHYLQADPGYNAQISLLKTNNYYLREDKFSKNPILAYLLKKQKKQVKFNRKFSAGKISDNNFDLFHPTYYDPYFLQNLKKPFVLTVHDMIHEVYPEFFAPYDEFAMYKRLTIAKADHIIAISASTKHDLQQIYGVPEEKITVVYHGVEIKEKKELLPLSNTDSPYILYVGDRFGYKNFYRFIAAYKLVSEIHKDVKLVCTGAPFNAVEREFLIRQNVLDKIIQISASDEDLNALYQNTICYVNPSLLEGFGFPILEAFGNDCIALLSNTNCFHEIAGDAALYFDPSSAEDMAAAMLNVMQREFNKTELIKKGNAQLSKFSLEKSMKETQDVYARILNGQS